MYNFLKKTIMKKKLFAVLACTVLVFGLSGCKSKPAGDPTAKDAQGEEPKTEEVASFDYTPAEPVDGVKKAVVELGASGFNLFIIEVDKDKNWKALKKEFGSSLVSENMTDVNTIKSKLEDYINSIVSFGVPGKNIHFVVSSGAAKEPIIETISSALKSIGYFVNIVTPEQEATYAFNCTLPKGYEDKAFVVDLGSGNTKISYKNGEEIVAKETYGAKYFQKDVDEKTAYDDAKAKVTDIPDGNKETLFLIGGVPYQMAKMLKKGDERFTVLSTNISDYDDLVKEEGEKVKAGLNIYKGILDATGAKQVVFDWDANFTIGFLLGMND